LILLLVRKTKISHIFLHACLAFVGITEEKENNHFPSPENNDS